MMMFELFVGTWYIIIQNHIRLDIKKEKNVGIMNEPIRVSRKR